MKLVIIICCAVVVFLPIGSGNTPDPAPPGPIDLPAEVFADYLSRWRDVQIDTAAKLREGLFESSQQSRDYRALNHTAARKAAMQELAAYEQEILGGDKYTFEKEAEILEGYAEAVRGLTQ